MMALLLIVAFVVVVVIFIVNIVLLEYQDTTSRVSSALYHKGIMERTDDGA